MGIASRRYVSRESIWGGLFAGAFFAAMQTVLAAMSGVRPGIPQHLFTGLGAGSAAVRPGMSALLFVLGIGVHFALSVGFGLVFGAVVGRLRKPLRDSYATLAVLGGLFGLMLWMVNVQIVARALLPLSAFEALRLDGFAQLLAHVVAFGVPLGLFVCMKLRDVEMPGVFRARHRFQNSNGIEERYSMRSELSVKHREFERPEAGTLVRPPDTTSNVDRHPPA